MITHDAIIACAQQAWNEKRSMIDTIKAIRACTRYGLKESKDFFELHREEIEHGPAPLTTLRFTRNRVDTCSTLTHYVDGRLSIVCPIDYGHEIEVRIYAPPKTPEQLHREAQLRAVSEALDGAPKEIAERVLAALESINAQSSKTRRS